MTVSPLIVKNDAWRSVQILKEWYLLRTTDDGCITLSSSADEERYPKLCRYDDSQKKGFCICTFIFGCSSLL